jgi:uncharacterized protein (DUF433 family)
MAPTQAREGEMGDITSLKDAFAPEHVVRLAGLTMGQLAYWDKTGFFHPQYADENRKAPYSRVYSFKDVVALRTLSLLKGKHGVSLPHLREVAEKLSTHGKLPWADIKLKIWNRKVQFDDPETGLTVGVLDGQYVLLPILDVIAEVEREAKALKRRDPSTVGKLEKHRYVAHNAPVVAGTRIPVAAIMRFLEDGFSREAIIKEYPGLKAADIDAVIRGGKAALAA